MAQEWDIKPRGEACADCQTPFADQQPYFAALIFDERGYRRADYCQACWLARDDASILPFSIWQGIFHLPPPAPEEPLKKETAESLLRKLMEQDDPANGNVVYILAVMLERKRLLVERDIQHRDDGTMLRVYEHRKTGETFVVPDPRLRLDQLETVQQEVMALLGWGKEAAPGDPAAAPANDAPPGPQDPGRPNA